MKIILSRKGFDSSNGGSPSPIMPDGSLLSMPIPSDNSARYTDLHYHGLSYSDLLHQLNPKFVYDHCHVDPDIREDVWAGRIPNWKPAFGQVNSAQGVLMNAGVEVTWKNVWKKIKGIDPIAFDSKKKYIFQPLLTKPFHEIQKGAQFPTFIKSCIQKSLYWKNVQEAKTSSGVTQKEAESAEGGSESK